MKTLIETIRATFPTAELHEGIIILDMECGKVSLITFPDGFGVGVYIDGIETPINLDGGTTHKEAVAAFADAVEAVKTLALTD